MTTYQEPAPP